MGQVDLSKVGFGLNCPAPFSRPKIKLFLFPLTRPNVKKAADRKNYIYFFFFFAVPVFIIFRYRFLVSAAYKRLEIDNSRLFISESSFLFSLIQYGGSCRLRIGSNQKPQ